MIVGYDDLTEYKNVKSTELVENYYILSQSNYDAIMESISLNYLLILFLISCMSSTIYFYTQERKGYYLIKPTEAEAIEQKV